MSPLYAGAARVKLDPPAGLAMLGYGNRVGRNTGVHDDLAAQALVLSDGTAKVAIAGIDVLALGVRIADDIRERVAATAGIPADSTMVCATHTHSAPALNIFATPRADANPAEGRDLEWERALPQRIASAIIQAHANLQPATLRAATASFTLGINRRLMRPQRQIQLAANRSGPADAEVVALGAYRPDGTAIAYVMNYPCHGVVLCEDNLLYSRDWPGFAMDEIESASSTASGLRPISIFSRVRPATSIRAAAAASTSPNTTAAPWAVLHSTRSPRHRRSQTPKLSREESRSHCRSRISAPTWP